MDREFSFCQMLVAARDERKQRPGVGVLLRSVPIRVPAPGRHFFRWSATNAPFPCSNTGANRLANPA